MSLYDGKLLTVKETMNTLRIGKTLLYQLLRSGVIVGFKLGSKWKIPQQSIDTYISSLCQKAHTSNETK